MINTSSNADILGSSCIPVVHKKYGCGTIDFTVTDLQLDHSTGILTLYQNPNNCVSVGIPEIVNINSINNLVVNVENNKVDKVYNLKTTNGITGGGTLETSRTLEIKPNDKHIQVSEDGLKIKKFTEVDTSGTVPSPGQQQMNSSHFLNALGQWTKIDAMRVKDVLEQLNNTISDPTSGDIYIIKDYSDPNTSVTVNGQTFLPNDVIMWNGSRFIDIGQVSVKVNLSGMRSANAFTINNSAGNGVVIPTVSGSNAGLITASELNELNTLYSRDFVINLSDITRAGSTITFDVTNQTGGNNSTKKTITIPAATADLAGIMSSTDKIKLDSITDVYLQSDWNATNTGSKEYIRNKPTVLNSSSTQGKLVPNPASGTTGERYLRYDGTWSEVKSSPPITVSTVEPTGNNAVEGAIWIIP